MLNSNLRRRLLGAVFAGAMGLIFAGVASAGPWGNAAGANAGFGWSGGFNNTGKFGDPTVTSIGFSFDNTINFRAEGGGGSGASATDFARVTADSATSNPAGAPLVHEIKVIEVGTWSSSIPGCDPGDFTVQADMAVFRFQPGPSGSSGSLSMAVTFFPNGSWMAERTLTAGQGGNPPFTDVDWRRFQVTVTDTLQVRSDAPAGSYIEKTMMRIYVPEPSAVLFLLAGMGPWVLRRSRS